MIDAQLALQGGIVTAVKASTAMRALIGNPTRIYDRVPTNGDGQVVAPFPYVSFGPMTTIGIGGDCDTGDEIDAQLDGWSRAVGSVEAKQVGAALRSLLSAGFAVPGYRLVYARPLSLQAQGGLDGITTQTILKMRFSLTPTA